MSRDMRILAETHIREFAMADSDAQVQVDGLEALLEHIRAEALEDAVKGIRGLSKMKDERQRLTISDHANRDVQIPHDTFIRIPLAAAASAIVDYVGEDKVAYFPKFWANGDGIEVSFRRVPK